MSRLDALLAAMPRIAEAITGLDDDLRHVAFDMLTKAALEDAAQPNHDGLGGDHQTGVDYPATSLATQAAQDSDWQRRLYGPRVDPARFSRSDSVTAPAVFDTGDQRIVGTYTGNGVSGTFTPDGGPTTNFADLYAGTGGDVVVGNHAALGEPPADGRGQV